jgi:hypothetical protein
MAAELRNVAKACKLAGMSRSQFYALRKAYKTSGREGLAPRTRRTPEMPNRTPAAIEQQILVKTQKNPAVSYLRLAQDLMHEGFAVTPTMVRYVWQRYGLSTRVARLRWLKKQHGQRSRMRANSLNNTPQPKAEAWLYKKSRSAPASLAGAALGE